MIAAVLSFAVVAGLLTMTPGLDTVLVLRASITGGHRAGFASAFGICAGLLAWGVAAAIGVSALLATSQVAYDILRIGGAGYMVFLGARLIWQRRPGATPPSVAEAADDVSDGATEGPAAHRPLRTDFMRGFLTNLLNPKIGVFYVAVLPQFLPSNAPSAVAGLVLACVHVLESLIWFTALILGSQLLRASLRRPSVQTWTDRITGGVLIGFGVRIAWP